MNINKFFNLVMTVGVILLFCSLAAGCANSPKETIHLPGEGAFSPEPPPEPSAAEKEGKAARADDALPSTSTGRASAELDETALSDIFTDTALAERERGTSTAVVPSASGLKAGFADDNKQFNYFLRFLEDFQYVDHFNLPITERIILKIRDSAGRSLPGALVKIFDSNSKLLCQGKSYADGTFLFFPSEYGNQTLYTAQVDFMQKLENVHINRYGVRTIEVNFELTRPDYQEVPLDILFIMDTTGSMGEEIERLRTTIEIINMNLVSLSSRPQVRFGMVLYKDRGPDEEYITQIIPLTGDLPHFKKKLNEVYADGGGDYPEDLQSALEDSVKKIEWVKTGIKLAFIITDAPPHLDYGQQYTYVQSARDARTEGIKIFSVGTGGLDVYGEYILRQISQYTYAKYIFLTYGEGDETDGGAAGSVSHHTGSNFQTDKLEAIIIRFAKEELSQLTNQPLEEGEEYFQAVQIKTEKNEKTLGKLFAMAIDQLIDYSSLSIPAGTRASVLPIVTGNQSYLLDAEYFTDQLIGSLTANKVFTMVERKDIQKILAELKLQLSGLSDDTSAVKVGSFLGAEMLISGTLYVKQDSYELFLKLLRVETTEVLGVTKAIIARELGLSQ